MRHTSGHRLPDRLPHEVEQAAEALVLAWTRSIDSAHSHISPPQLRALLILERHDALNLGSLGEALGAIPSSVSRLCDRLQATGLVSRHASDVDRREIAIRLTPAGRELLRRLHRAREEHLAEILGRMSPTGRNALLIGLREFARAVNASRNPFELT